MNYPSFEDRIQQTKEEISQIINSLTTIEATITKLVKIAGYYDPSVRTAPAWYLIPHEMSTIMPASTNHLPTFKKLILNDWPQLLHSLSETKFQYLTDFRNAFNLVLLDIQKKIGDTATAPLYSTNFPNIIRERVSSLEDLPDMFLPHSIKIKIEAKCNLLREPKIHSYLPYKREVDALNLTWLYIKYNQEQPRCTPYEIYLIDRFLDDPHLFY